MYDCSIIIPTHNRPKLLLRCISYYEKKIFKNKKIIIVDSSKKKFIYKFKKNFCYHFNSKEKFNSKILFGIKNSKTKYAIICNDDDFISNYGLNKGLVFLKKNLEYSSVQGEFIFFRKLNKINTYTYQEAYFDTLKYNLDLKDKNKIDRIRSIYLKRPHWYNGLHYRKNLETSFRIASKGNDLHYSEIILPIIIGLKGHVKTFKHFWYAKDSNVYKDLSILDQKKRKKMLNELLDKKSLIRNKIDEYLIKEIKKNYSAENIDSIIQEFFSKYLIANKKNFFERIKNIIKRLPYLFIPELLKNLLRVSINFIKNKSVENASSLKNYGPSKNNFTFNDWLLMKLHVEEFNKKFNYKKIYKNLK